MLLSSALTYSISAARLCLLTFQGSVSDIGTKTYKGTSDICHMRNPACVPIFGESQKRQVSDDACFFQKGIL